MVQPGMSQAQLFEVLCRMLSTLRDGHVNIYSSMDIGRNWSWKEDYPENLDRELREEYLGTDYHMASGMKYRILEDNIAYVVYESFSDAVGEGNLDEMLYYLRLCDGLILDIRGNSGGLLTNVERIASRFTNERRLVGYVSHKTGKRHNDFSPPEAQKYSPSRSLPTVYRTLRSRLSSHGRKTCRQTPRPRKGSRQFSRLLVLF